MHNGWREHRHGLDSVRTRSALRDEHSTFTWLLEVMIARAGFAIEEVSYSDDQLSARYALRKPRHDHAT